jgi:predicted dehydrogenase
MPEDKELKDVSRRSFIQRTAIGGAGLLIAKDVLGSGLSSELSSELSASTPKSANKSANAAMTMMGVPFEARERVRLGIIGVGGRGTNLLEDLLAIEKVEVKAICDLVPEKVARAQQAVTKAGQPQPAGFSKGELDFKNLTELDLDIVYIATPWNWHVPMAVAAMKNGKHAAVEVPACTTLQECWEIVDTSEATRKHCVILENCCYGSNEMMVLGMVRDGLFGEITHGEAAYLHDLRTILTSSEGEGQWRRFPHVQRNGNLYPTHGLGPVAHYMDIHHGDRFDYMVSVSSSEASLSAYVKANFPDGDPMRNRASAAATMRSPIFTRRWRLPRTSRKKTRTIISAAITSQPQAWKLATSCVIATRRLRSRFTIMH